MFSLLNDTETFLDIEGYEGRYSISNMGRVYSHWYEIIMIPQLRNGYPRVQFKLNGKHKNFTVHNLVWDTFVGNRQGELTVDHIDRNPQNNNISNLRLATKREQASNTSVRSTNKLGEKHISIEVKVIKEKIYKYYLIVVNRQNVDVLKKYLPMDKFSLDDAVKVRDEFLKNESHGYKNS